MSTKKRISMILLASMLVINPFQAIKASASTIDSPLTIVKPTTEKINKMIFANGKYFIAGGDIGDGKKAVLYSSVDAVTWQAINIANCTDGTSSLDLDSINDIKYANGLFVAVGNSASNLGVSMAVSTDGVNWKAVRQPNSNLYSVVYSVDYGIWAASGYTTASAKVVYASLDNGVSWYDTGDGGGYGITYGNDQFWTVGKIMDHPVEQRLTSDINYANYGELDTWAYFENNLDTEQLKSIDYINGWLMAVSDSKLYLKGDDYFYDRVLTGVPATVGKFSQIAYVNNQYVIPAGNWDGTKWNAVAIVSSDLSNWSLVPIADGCILTSVVYKDGEYKMTDSIGNVYSTKTVTENSSTLDINKIDKSQLPYNSNLKVGTVVQCVYLNGVVQYTIGKNGTINNLKVIQ